MWFRFVSYLKFLMVSTNQHGVHSPFVFRYVTQCLYTKKKMHKNRSINVLLKTIAYFGFEKVSIKNKTQVKKLVQQTFPEIQFDGYPCDLLFVDKLASGTFQQLLSEGKLHNDSIILVDSIHRTAEDLEHWNRLIALPEITVSIDMFHCGLLSIRREQVKEHFRIRI